MKKVFLLGFLAGLFIYMFYSVLRHQTELITTSSNVTSSDESIPNRLSLPFSTSDINTKNGIVNPIGVYRFSKDQKGRGHSGLDIPLAQGAPIYAVAEGEIVEIKSAGDPWGGMGVVQLLQKTTSGEGWGFIYEHITPTTGLKVGAVIKRGDLIGTKTAPNDFTAHFQYSRLFSEYKYTDQNQCWPNFLSENAQETLNSWWNSYKTSDFLLNSWKTNTEEGKFPFKGLFDSNEYPEGPLLCYSPGTDVL